MPNRPADGTRINEAIRISPVRVIKDDGTQEIIDTRKALQMAKNAGLDLVEVSPNAKPPVCRIINYSKYKFEQAKKAKAAKAKQHVVKLKEIKMHPKTAENDYLYRIKQMRGFLESGMKVRLIMQFRGREMAHMDYGRRLMERAKEDLGDVGEFRHGGENVGVLRLEETLHLFVRLARLLRALRVVGYIKVER